MSNPNSSKPIFVLDDDPVVRLLLGETLKAFGYQVRSFASWNEAHAALQENSVETDLSPPCALFMVDLIMPDTNGFQVIEALRRERGTIPIILLSANADRAVTEKAKQPGLQPNAILEKPWSPAVLKKVIEETLSSIKSA